MIKSQQMKNLFVSFFRMLMLLRVSKHLAGVAIFNQFPSYLQISKTVKICASLLQLDYTIAEIPNYNGDLSTNYPSHILVPESEKPRSGSSPAVIYEQQTFDATKFRDLIKSARLARCRARFPIPVIFYRGKYVCRSATLSGGAEIYTRSGFDYFYGSANGGKVNDEIG